MGVYYDAKVAWGLLIPGENVEDGLDLEDVYILPEGFTYSMGGDHTDGKNIAYVLHPPHASQPVLDTMRDSGFGVYAMDDIYRPDEKDVLVLRDFCRTNDVSPVIGWFAISSVG